MSREPLSRASRRSPTAEERKETILVLKELSRKMDGYYPGTPWRLLANMVTPLIMQRNDARADAAFYRCCALSGERPKPGDEPSARSLVRETNE